MDVITPNSFPCLDLNGFGSQVIILGVVAILTLSACSFIRSPLRQYPGPFLAGENQPMLRLWLTIILTIYS